MTYYLTPDAGKLERNRVKSVASRVINLTEVDATITVERMKNTMIEVVQAKSLIVDVDETIIKEKTKFFASKEWIYGGII